MKHRLLLAALAIILPIGVITFSLIQRQASLTVPPQLTGILWPQARPVQNFQLVDQHGGTFGTERFKQRFSLVFFGYTSCPDICPGTMTVLNSVLRDLGGDCPHCQAVFVSVDPQRDNAERLREYAGYFNPDIIALSGDLESIQKFAKQVGAMFIKEPPEATENYAMSHTASIFLIDTDARIIGTFSYPHDTVQIVRDLRRIFKARS